MKTLILPQPFASMVVMGIKESLLNTLGNLHYGEKIYVYASELGNSFMNDLDYRKPIIRKLYNEMCLGNFPDDLEELPTNCYVGYFRVGKLENITTNESGFPEHIPIILPRTFKAGKYGKESTEAELEKARASRRFPQRMRRDGDTLIVPVGKYLWKKVNDLYQCRGLFLFWEDYMEEYVPILFSMNYNSPQDEIYRVVFHYGKQYLTFFTDFGVGQNIANLHSGEPAWIFDFNLEGRVDKHTIIRLPNPNDPKESRPVGSSGDAECEYKMKLNEYKRPRPIFISTPMGGMTKWKR